MDDEAWMRRAVLGDTRAFGEIVRRHQARLQHLAIRMLNDREAGLDATQEAFLRLWRARERYRPQPAGLGIFLLRIVRNVCLDQIRARAGAPQRATEARGCLPDCCNTETEVRERALTEAVRRAVQALPELQRAVFVLSHYEGLTYREIAEALECPLGTVASRKAAAVESLRRQLADWNDER